MEEGRAVTVWDCGVMVSSTYTDFNTPTAGNHQKRPLSPLAGSMFQWTVPYSGWWLSLSSLPSSPSSSTLSSATSLGDGPIWPCHGLSCSSHPTPNSSSISQSEGRRRRQRDASHRHETLTPYYTTAPAQTVAYRV